MKMIANKYFMRQTNSKLVLQEIFNNEFTTRAEISRTLGLNKSTVSSIYEDLKSEQLVEEVGEGEASSGGGRKPTKIRINANFGFTLGFDISFHKLHYIANYLNGDVIYQGEKSIDNKSIQEIIQIIKETTDHFGATVKSIHGLLGICLSIHGIVDDQQKIVYSPFIDFERVDIKELLMAEYHVPIILENESNLTAVYVRDFIMRYQQKNLITVSIHKGIGSGIIVDNQLFRGFSGRAGEVGRTLTKNSDGKWLPIEQICSEDAIINRLKSDLKMNNLDRAGVVKMYNEGNSQVADAVNEFIQEISTLIYNSSMYFDTDAIYIGSPLMESAPQIFDKISARVKQLKDNSIQLVQLQDSDKATLLGACSVATHHALELVGYPLSFGKLV